jgi:hypothetical protein
VEHRRWARTVRAVKVPPVNARALLVLAAEFEFRLSELFELCQALNPMDAVVRQYVERCQKIQMQFAGGGWGAES